MAGPRPTKTPSLTPTEIDNILHESLGEDSDRQTRTVLLPILTVSAIAGAAWMARQLQLDQPRVTQGHQQLQTLTRQRVPLINSINTTTRSRLRAKLEVAAAEEDEDALVEAAWDGLDGVFDSAMAARAEGISLTEVGVWWATGEYQEMAEEGVPGRQWFTMMDSKVRDTHAAMEGQCVGLEEDFETGGGVLLAYPGDPSGPPEEVYNCRCVEVPVEEGCDQLSIRPRRTTQQLEAWWRANMASRAGHEKAVKLALRRLFRGQRARASAALEKALRF
jgi:hypothetical protein